MRYYPKIYKWVKVHKKQKITFSKRELVYSRYGLIIQNYGIITNRQIETVRRYLSRRMRKKSGLLRRVTLHLNMTKKSSKARMGKGCGKFHRWISYVRPGMIIFEIKEIIQRSSRYDLVTELNRINTKLSFKCRFQTYPIRFNWYIR